MKKFYTPLIAILITSSVSGQDNAGLRFNPEKNRIYRFKSSSEQTIVQTVNGNQQTVESVSEYIVSIKMVDATPAFVVTEIRLDTIFSKANNMGKTVVMSSVSEGDIKSKETSDLMSWFMNRISRNPLYAKIDYSGKVTEIINLKLVSDMVLRDTSSMSLTGPVRAALKTQAAGMVSEDAFKNIIEMFTSGLPGKPVSKGDTWSATNTMNAGGMLLQIITSYKLEGINGNSANVTAESAIRTAPNALPMESGGAKITYDDLKGSSKSNSAFDINTGLRTGSETKTHIAGNLGVTVPGMSMQIPMDISGKTTITMLKK